MGKKNKLIIAIIIVAAIGILAIVWGAFIGMGPDLSQGDRKILVLAADETEQRAGIGAVDMAFIVHLKNGSIAKYSPVYPGGLTHPTESQPAGAGSGKLLLHDSLWYEDNEKGMELAKEIVESNYNVTVDGVVAVNIEGLDAIIDATGPVKVNGSEVNISAVDLVRENDELHGGSMTRGEAVMTLAKALSTAANNESTRNAMVQVALDQYSKGNILMIPQGSFAGLMASKGIGSIL